MNRLRHWLILVTAGGLAGCSGNHPTQPQRVATGLEFLVQPSGATAGVALPPVKVRAVDATDTLVTNFTGTITVALAANPGGATLSGTKSVAAVGGIATFSTLTLDQSDTGYTLSASATGLTGATSTAFVIDSGPSTMTVVVGNRLPGLIGYAVNVRPAVKITDAHNNPVANVMVTFATASSASGSISGSTTIATNSSGIAQIQGWVLGATAKPDTVTATVTGTPLTGAPAQFIDTGYAATFPITIQPYGAGLPPTAQAAFDSAAAKWRRAIYRPLSTASLSGATAGYCDKGTPALSGTTTGLVIYAAVDSIDGSGKILAESGPCLVRTSGSDLTAVGVMKFDSVDIHGLITGGTLNAVVLHEMSHVLGFGTLWGPPSPPVVADCVQSLSTPPGTINDTYFSCPKAQAEFDSIGGGNYTGGNAVPVENCGTSPYVYPACTTGTVNGHWRQVVFGNELMVGFLPANPQLSMVTIAAQEDLGYTVNYAAADPYTHTFSVSPIVPVPVVNLGADIWKGPLAAISPGGTLVRIR